jgi:hypothetical protein
MRNPITQPYGASLNTLHGVEMDTLRTSQHLLLQQRHRFFR